MIEVKNITKKFKIYDRGNGVLGGIKTLFSNKYREITAVDNISFQIEKGELVSYIGQNGAGKSTTIKMMSGILKPTSGLLLIRGKDPFYNRRENNLKTGVVFGQRTQLWWDIPVLESFNLLKSIYEVDDKIFKKNLDKFNEILKIKKFYKIPLRKLSLGQKMICELVAALLHSPDIVYLDEPTIGLDINIKENIRNFIKYINLNESSTIILTTHDLNEVEKLAKRILIIDKGKIIYDGTVENIVKMDNGNSEINISLTTSIEKKDIEKTRKILDKNNCKIEMKNNYSIMVKYNKNIISSPHIYSILHSNFDIGDFSIKNQTLEDIIKKIYKEI